MKLLLLTTPYFFTEEHHILTALFEEGLEILHLRKPETGAIFSERLLRLIPEKYHKRIVVHDHFYLKTEYKLRGIHLNQRNLELPPKYKGHISLTCQTSEEVELFKGRADYVILNNVFDNRIAQERPPRYTEDELRAMRDARIIDKKVMALGGINLERIKLCRELGFGGAVLLGEIWNRFNPQTTPDFNDIVDHFRLLRRAAE